MSADFKTVTPILASGAPGGAKTSDTSVTTNSKHGESGAGLGASVERLAPPIARREPVEAVIHDDRRVDHYAWLRDKESAEVLEYLAAENAYTDAILEPTLALQEKLYQEMLGRILQTDLSVPYLLRGYKYFSRTEEGQQYAMHCRQRERKAPPKRYCWI